MTLAASAGSAAFRGSAVSTESRDSPPGAVAVPVYGLIFHFERSGTTHDPAYSAGVPAITMTVAAASAQVLVICFTVVSFPVFGFRAVGSSNRIRRRGRE